MCSVVLFPALNPVCSSAIVFKPDQDYFQHDFARTPMTDEANGSAVLAELYVALYKDCYSATEMDRCMTYDFSSFSTVFQLY